MGSSSPLAARSGKYSKPLSKEMVFNASFGEEKNNSEFSEVSTRDYDFQKIQHLPQSLMNPESEITAGEKESALQGNYRPMASKIESRDTGRDISFNKANPTTQEEGGDRAVPAERPDEDAQLAEKLVSIAMNAGPTPLKPMLSLVERTRQSMVLTSPGADLVFKEAPPPLPQMPSVKETSLKADGSATLAERTRQSISLVPAKSRRSRDSTHTRRSSKIFPTNQFETPRRQPALQKMTPPEELMSPGAGYDSVFKSRPRVAFSPAASPDPDGQHGHELEILPGQSIGQVDDSLSARLIT